MHKATSLHVGAIAAALSLAACGPSGEGANDGEPTTIGEDTLSAIEGDGSEEALVSFSIPDDELVTGDGVGPARVGMTLAVLRDALGAQPIRFVSSYMVDLSAVCVDTVDRQELYCAAIRATDQPSADDEVVMVATRHPRFRTQEGVGPGVSISDAETVYGPAVLLYNEENEGREYVEFDRGPAGSIGFRPLSPSDPDARVGIYEEGEGPYFETEVYRPDAVIASIEVYGGER